MTRAGRYVLSCAALAATVTLPTHAGAQAGASRAPGATTAAVGAIRGTIYDSLSRQPLQGAAVFVSGTSRIATTDDDGRFSFDSVPAGRRALTFSTPALDSLGLFTMGRDVDVVAGRSAEVALATPSFPTIWRTLCANARATRGDSGIVYGAVIDAATDRRMQGARVVFTWWDIAKQAQNVTIDRPVLVARSDSVGNYYACGLPADINIAMDVDAGLLSSGATETMLDRMRVTRRDMLVSADMHVSDSVRRAAGSAVVDDGLGLRRRGTSTLRGEVRDSKGALVAGALVTLPSADTSARTSADGQFVLGGLPAGTQAVRVRKLGNGPLARTVDLRPGREETLTLVLPPATVLAAVNVRADRVNPRLTAFDRRKTTGLGYFVGERELAFKPDMTSALNGLPSLRVAYSRGVTQLTMERGPSRCQPSIWLNGTFSSPEEISFFRPDELHGIEVYSNPQDVPAELQRGPLSRCGAVAVWTKDAR